MWIAFNLNSKTLYWPKEEINLLIKKMDYDVSVNKITLQKMFVIKMVIVELILN